MLRPERAGNFTGAAQPDETVFGVEDQRGHARLGQVAGGLAMPAPTGRPAGPAVPTLALPSVSSTGIGIRAGPGPRARRIVSEARTRAWASGVRPPVGSDRMACFGRLDAVCRRQEQLGLRPAEGDHADAVAAFVGVAQQAEHGSFDRLHPPPRRHRAGRIDDEQDQRSRPARSAPCDGGRTAGRPACRRRRARCGPRTEAWRRRRGGGAPGRGQPACSRPDPRPPCCVSPGRFAARGPTGRPRSAGSARPGPPRRPACQPLARRASFRSAPPVWLGRGLASGSVVRSGGVRRWPGRPSAIRSSSRWWSSPGFSNGRRRRRCGRTSAAAQRTSSSLTADRPASAAEARDALCESDVRPHPVGAKLAAKAADQNQQLVIERDLGKPAAGGGDPGA